MVLMLVAALAMDSSRLQIGTAWGGEEVLHFVNAEQQIDETHRFRRWFQVTGQEERMWIVDCRKRLLSTRIDDTDIPTPPETEPSVAKEWLSPAGFLLDLEPFDGGDFRLDRLIHFWLPSNQPDEWNAELTTTSTHTISKGKATFHSTALRSKSFREYQFTFSEPQRRDGIEVEGKMRFDIGTGRLLKADLEINRGVMPGGLDLAHITLGYTDSKSTKPLND